MNLQFILPRQLIAKIEEWMCGHHWSAFALFLDRGALFEDLLPHELLWAWSWEPYASNPHTEISALKEQL